MTGPSDPRRILAETDWSGLENRNGPAYPETPDLLAGLASEEQAASEAGIFHLTYELIDYPNVHTAAVPAAHYVAVLVGDPRTGNRRRADLLTWLATLAGAVSDARERDFVELAGYSPMDHPTSTFRKVRDIRPHLFAGVAACLDDPDPVVREAAVAAAVVLAEAPELASRRAMLKPLIKDVLAVSSSSAHRQLATTALRSWGDASGPA
ncbi:hypothetical protein [Actinoplanes sp. M2I2]|uniref:hypothetical protein n=1 Tax=Actinoplanes sp. M2I2 TaxID=1734444 RepID=UPI0020225BAC|nr:hypothetical protein [Actinoplanes sp. M2I2]